MYRSGVKRPEVSLTLIGTSKPIKCFRDIERKHFRFTSGTGLQKRPVTELKAFRAVQLPKGQGRYALRDFNPRYPRALSRGRVFSYGRVHMGEFHMGEGLGIEKLWDEKCYFS